MKEKNSQIVAAFDFDGTLTKRDTLVPFLLFSFGYKKVAAGLILLLPVFILYLFGRTSRQSVKEAILTRFLKGISSIRLEEMAKIFAEQGFKNLLKQEAVKKLRWHQSQGHLCIIVSAGIEPYIKAWAEGAGVAITIASKLAIDSSLNVTGKIDGANCWGKEKVNRLKELLGEEKNYLLYAYGDSRGDKELLDYSDYPFYRGIYQGN